MHIKYGSTLMINFLYNSPINRFLYLILGLPQKLKGFSKPPDFRFRKY